MKVQGFPPIASTESVILILGTAPGRLSLNLRQYYAEPRNSFWFLVKAVCDHSEDSSYRKKVKNLEECGIAIWDVLLRCERIGSSDSGIIPGSEEPNDFEWFLQLHPNIHQIFFNGNKANEYFRKLVFPDLSPEIRDKLNLRILPSTSPANTHLTKSEKLADWRRQISSVREQN